MIGISVAISLRVTSLARRGLLLALGVLALAPASGCTAFQRVSTSQWLATGWCDDAAQVSQVMAFWDNRVHITENTRNDGAPLPVMAGRVFLVNEEAKKLVEADGFIRVQMFDVTDPRPGAAQRKLASWEFDPHSLKRLMRKDTAGIGYTLVLPWQEHDPSVKKVRMQVGYFPKTGSPHYTSPQMLTLQSADAPQPQIFERPAAPVSYSRPAPK
jgi:hypothetical protein